MYLTEGWTLDAHTLANRLLYLVGKVDSVKDLEQFSDPLRDFNLDQEEYLIQDTNPLQDREEYIEEVLEEEVHEEEVHEEVNEEEVQEEEYLQFEQVLFHLSKLLKKKLIDQFKEKKNENKYKYKFYKEQIVEYINQIYEGLQLVT